MTLLGHPLPRQYGGKALVLLAFVAVHVAISVVFVAPGHFTIDEGVYDLMVRAFVATGGLEVWNGYEEFASPELVWPTVSVRDGVLVPQYPGIFALLAAPFYWLLGYRGLFLLSALAFAATLALCFAIAQRLFRDPALSLNACLILALTTFAWEYSQAAWPHALSMLVVALAVYCAIVALQASDSRASTIAALAAGLTLGFGIGVRLDTVFALPAVVLPLLFVDPWRPRAALAASMGLLPGLAVLGAVNHAKFGIFSPFSYGAGHLGGGTASMMPYLPIVSAGLVLAFGAWAATRPFGRKLIEGNRRTVAIGAALVGAAAIATPQGWALASKLAAGAYQLLVDFRIRDLAIEEGGLSRGPGGGMVYLGSLKKALLQSCPYLVALALPLIGLLRGRDVRALGVLFLVPAGFVTVYAYFAWHGGLAFNLRYLVPTLPFLAILTAYAWREVAPGLAPRWLCVATLGGLAVFAAHVLAAFPRPAPMATQETVFLTVPLMIAVGLGILLVASRVATFERVKALQGAAGAMMLVALVWGGLVSLTYDFPRSYFIRSARAEFSKIVAPLIEPDSILFVQYGDQFFGLIERGDVRIAMPRLDDYATFRPLIDFHLDAGRNVYLWRTPEIAATLERRPLLDGLSEVTLYEHANGALTELQRPRQARR